MNNVSDISHFTYKIAKLDVGIKINGRPMTEIDVSYLLTECSVEAIIIPKSVGIMIKTTENGSTREYFIPYSKVRSLEI